MRCMTPGSCLVVVNSQETIRIYISPFLTVKVWAGFSVCNEGAIRYVLMKFTLKTAHAVLSA